MTRQNQYTLSHGVLVLDLLLVLGSLVHSDIWLFLVLDPAPVRVLVLVSSSRFGFRHFSWFLLPPSGSALNPGVTFPFRCFGSLFVVSGLYFWFWSLSWSSSSFFVLVLMLVHVQHLVLVLNIDYSLVAAPGLGSFFSDWTRSSESLASGCRGFLKNSGLCNHILLDEVRRGQTGRHQVFLGCMTPTSHTTSDVERVSVLVLVESESLASSAE